LECLRRATHDTRALRALVVMPTLALARQWRQVFLANTGLGEAESVGWTVPARTT